MITRVTRSTRYVNSSKPLPKRSVTIKPQTQASSVTKDGVVTKTVSPSTQSSSVPAQTRELTWWDQASLVGEGIVNQATDYQGIVNPSYENRSILNKAIDRTIQGDFAGAGEIISQNPARFAGNVIFEAGTAIIPVGAVAKGVATGTRVASKGIVTGTRVGSKGVVTGTRVVRSGIEGVKYGVKNNRKVRIAKMVASQIKRDPKMLVPKKSVNYFTGERLPGTRGYFEQLSFVTGIARKYESEIPKELRKTRKLVNSMSSSDEIASRPFIQGGKKLMTYGPDGDRVLPADVVVFKTADPRRVRDFFGRADNITSMSDKIKPRSRINYIPNPLNIYQKADITYKSSTGNFKKASVKRPKPNTGRV